MKMNVAINLSEKYIICMQGQNKQWSWMDCNLTIKRASKKNQNQVFEILESEYTIQLEEDGSEAELNIEISMEKRINYEEGSGFTWHKSWNIPSIEVKISKRDLNSIKAQLGITRVYCEITSGYPIRKMVEFYIQEVTVEGETRKEIGSNGVARFSNLKFSETSFNHERNKFSLILIVFTKNEQRSRSVLKSFISMPIYVDSRKQARKKQPANIFLSELIPVDAFQEELQLRHLDKKQVKPKQKLTKAESQAQLESSRGMGKYMIKYSLAGFISYYKSANIRNKIKHPFYFSYHFHQLITLYYNREVANSPIAALKYIEKPSKHDSKKVLLVALSPAQGEQNEQTLQDLKKQFLNLFENNWKYFFIEVAIKGNIYYNYMIQQKVNLGGQKAEEEEKEMKKWVELPPQQILAAYSDYYTDIENRENEENKNSLDSQSMVPNENEADNVRRFEHFQLHQVIHIQSAFNNTGLCKKVKLEAPYEGTQYQQQ